MSLAYPAPDAELAVEGVAIEKRYGPTRALKSVSVGVRTGVVHALVGENGAGKSTFLGTVAGRVTPSAGTMRILGRPHVFGNPRHARALGIAAIYQELTIVPAKSTQENVFLGHTPARMGVISATQMRQRYLSLCERLRVHIPADRPAGRLSVADQQMLEIMRGVQSDARVLLFDEPTTSLAPPERASLFRIMRELRAGGVTMMIVSHNLDEVLDIADAVTVFREGAVAASALTGEWTKASLVRAMIGHDLKPAAPRAPRPAAAGPPLLAARGVTVPGAIEGVDIEVRAGEVLGVGGLVGSGRTSLLRALSGLEPQSTGELTIDGRRTPWPRTPRTALGYGIALVPEDRKGQGLVLGMSVASNMTMASMEKVSRGGVLSSLAMKNSSLSVARDFGLAERHLLSTVRNLSGGNQQKALLGKWRLKTPRVLLVDEPTRGIDIGAKEEILATLKRMAAEGLGVVIVSSELEEVVEISDRVVVLSAGRRVAELAASETPVRVQDILNAAFEVGVNEHDR